MLVFVFVVLKAIAYWLDRYGLVFSDRSKFTGASYTDVHAVLPARTILFWIAIVIAAGLIASLWLRSTMLPGHRVRVDARAEHSDQRHLSGDPAGRLGQAEREPGRRRRTSSATSRRRATAYNIETGHATSRYARPTTSLEPTATRRARPTPVSINATLDNIRILDPNIVPPTFTKHQQNGNLYGFAPKLDIDRYTIDGSDDRLHRRRP